jgi:hypothetical protein
MGGRLGHRRKIKFDGEKKKFARKNIYRRGKKYFDGRKIK